MLAPTCDIMWAQAFVSKESIFVSIDFSTLRKWQQEAIEKYRVTNKKDFLVTATPGAGKTTFALTLAAKLLETKAVTRVIVIVPTDQLRTQWADSAIDKGIFLDPTLSNNIIQPSEDYEGYVATYAQVALAPQIHKRRTISQRTLVIFDEIHHAGEGLSWGTAVYDAFNNATRRLSLTGTPFRTSKFSRIPFIRYDDLGEGLYVSSSDYTYGYGEALSDSVVRPVTFAAYTGTASWETSAGDAYSASLDDEMTKDMEAKAFKALLSPEGQWIPHVIQVAHERLLETRKVIPDAGAMILASDKDSARAYAKIVRKVTGVAPTVVVSDDNSANKKIEQFRTSEDMWLIAVRMVSEGVDIPRLSVGIWATNYRTPLFFAQAVGRFVRARNKKEFATIFLPSLKPLLSLAAEMEAKRNHYVSNKPEEEPEDEMIEANQEERVINSTIVHGSSANFDHVLFNGKALDGMQTISSEDQEYLGIPGILNPEQVAALLRNRDAELRSQSKVENSDESQKASMYKRVGESRKELNKLVSRMALTRNVAHAHVHKMTQKAVPGPASSIATLEIIDERIHWLSSKL